MNAKRSFLKLAQARPDIFNPVWKMVFPLFRRPEAYAGDEYDERTAAFQMIFEQNLWQSEESVSGEGSTLAYTGPLRRELARLVRELEVKTLLDAPCGDYNWMAKVDLPGDVAYVGADLVPALIAQVRGRYGDDRHRFMTIDIVHDPIPPADLWLCRDVLFHLSHADVLATLGQAARAQSAYFLTTTYPFVRDNVDITSGGFRFINLCRAPFDLPPPLQAIDDFVTPYPPRVLGLWSAEQLRDWFSQRH